MKVFSLITILCAIVLVYMFGCTASRDPRRKEFRDLQRGRVKEDTSYIYTLPYEKGESFFVLQGYYSRLTHKNRAALDFKMKRGTKIVAARGGVVIRAKEDGTKGGLKGEYRSHGNTVVIEHEDGSRAGYWHLQTNGALVEVGDTVKAGQVIALSGKTGFTATPHLHFMVWRSGAGGWQQVATRFHTENGPHYLRPFHFYRNPK
jgi:murein DD-endopeptidase MepM/ murein hydrolase activator NlpD